MASTCSTLLTLLFALQHAPQDNAPLTPEPSLVPSLSQTSLVYTSPGHARPEFKAMTSVEAARLVAIDWRCTSVFRRKWRAMLKVRGGYR